MRRSPRHLLRRAADVAVTLVVMWFLVAIVDENAAAHPVPLVVAGKLIAVTQSVVLWWRRSRPVPVMAVALAGGLVVHLLAPHGVFPVAGLVALGSLATVRPPRFSLPALAALLALTALNFLTAPVEDAQFAMVFPIVVWALGEALRSRRSAVEEASRRAAGEEQARIARELHDVIAHSVSVIVVQAAAADDVFDERPDQARAALRSIESAGREALGELRRLLASVRPGAEGEPPHPQPGLERLEELVEPLRAAGLKVVVRREGPGGVPLPAGVDLSAYRIVQEALTNTLRHAAADRAEVTVRTSAETLELEVVDDGRGAPREGGGDAARVHGRGIAGMRERAAMLGGTLDAGPLPAGGFRVHARLPLEAVR
ncbi:sensor histidine kinase [Planomonospora corallina]|uniref:histidine kinase n=1 Tax=Planomonospora corallina TaxID=1806052 RepID=A0ABV8I3Q3_9ACTN